MEDEQKSAEENEEETSKKEKKSKKQKKSNNKKEGRTTKKDEAAKATKDEKEEENKGKDEDEKEEAEEEEEEEEEEGSKKAKTKKKLKKAESNLPNSVSHHKEWLRFDRWYKNKKRFPSALASRLNSEEGRNKLFHDYVEAGGNVDEILLKHEQELVESQKRKIKYGFRTEKWLRETHGDAKAERIMQRKKGLGLQLVII